MQSINQSCRRIIGVLCLSLTCLGPVHATEDTAPQPSGAGVLEEIVVTAQRRSENLQNVPIAITALTEKEMQAAGVDSTELLQVVTPGLTMNRQLTGSTPYLRGVGSQSVVAGVESPVATYVDGVYYASPFATIFSFNNIDQISVLKGPQGTLFGRNATGGLINITTRDPTVTPSVEGSVGYGNYETTRGSFYATGGVGNFAADIASVTVQQHEGFGNDLLTGGPVNRIRETGTRSKLLWTPSDTDKITFIADYSDSKTDLGSVLTPVAGTLGISGVPFTGSPYDTNANVYPGVEFRQWGASLKYEHDFGWAKFSTLTAYRFSRTSVVFDQDGSPVPFVNIDPYNDKDTDWQQELLLVGNAGKLQWTTGLFVFNDEAGVAPLAIQSFVIPPLNYYINAAQNTNSYSGFAQGTYSLTESTRATAGVRYTIDEREVFGNQSANAMSPAGAGTVLDSVQASKNFPKVTWRAGLDQTLSQGMLLYGSVSTGFKSGVFNTSALSPTPIAPETLTAFELGFKSEFLDHALRFNAATFYYNYKNIQLTRVESGTNILLNAASGKLDGLELESSYAVPVPVGALLLNANLSLLHAYYGSFPDGPVFIPTGVGGNITESRDLSGNTMIRSPRSTFSIGGDYSIPVPGGTFAMSAQFFRSAAFYWDPDDLDRQNAYNLLSAQLSYAFGEEQHYKARVYGQNLTNQYYSTFTNANAFGTLESAAPPRTYGVAFDFKF
jgi:iron complex outermembrane receptor protein